MKKFQRPVVLDCDPGHDDAFAIWLAAYAMPLRGIVTVHGNQSLEKVTTNALKILEVSGLSVPVYRGSSRPLIRQASYAPAMHGESGLDGPTLPDPEISAADLHGVDFLCQAAAEEEGLVVVATGPLTNIALALTKDPSFAANVSELSLMGGSTCVGNSTPVAEFNVWADPEAAAIVFSSGIPIRMVGLNVTRQAEAGLAEIERFRSLGTRVGTVAADLVSFYAERAKEMFGLNGASLHDPCAVAWLLDESLIEGRRMAVQVELGGTVTRGMTVCDQRQISGGMVDSTFSGFEASECLVGEQLDVDRFFELLIEALSSYRGGPNV